MSTAHKPKITTNKEIACLKSPRLRCCIYHANKCCYFNISEQDKFHAQLSMKKVL